MSPIEAKLKAFSIIGSKSKAARLLEVTPQALQKWVELPERHVARIVEACKGRVTRHQLRPDIYPKD